MGSIEQRLQDLEVRLRSLEALKEERTSEVERLEVELKRLRTEVDLLFQVEVVLQNVSARVLGKSTSMVDKLVTAGLKHVFPDQNLELKTLVDRYRGKTSIKFSLFEDGKSAPLLDGYGGGVIAIIGVLLRVVTIILLNQRRFLLLDESLSHVSEQYIPTASSLLRKLTRELGFTILLVTHQTGFAEEADNHYEAYRSRGATNFKRVAKPGT